MPDRSTVITRLDRVIQTLSVLGFLWMPRSSRGMTEERGVSEMPRSSRGMTRQGRLTANRTEGGARSEGGRKAPARGGGSGAARAAGPGGCRWQVEALK